MFVVKNRKIFYAISAILFFVSVLSITIWGLNLGIDFRGGSILEIKYYSERPDISLFKEVLEPIGIPGLSVREAGDNSFIIRSAEIGDRERKMIFDKAESLLTDDLTDERRVEEVRFSSIGPLIGREAAFKSLWAIFFVLLAIVLFIAYAFRKVSEPVSSWKYGLFAIVALFHDVVIPTGVFAVMGHFKGIEIDTLFVTALLVVLGFSVHDTIVVYDRIRENLKLEYGRKGGDFALIVGKSINQTFVRSINTSLSTLLALLVLYFVGPQTTQNFSLALIIGIVAGTYSSIFLASNLLVTVENWQKSKKLTVK